jgi:hypothetical protein
MNVAWLAIMGDDAVTSGWPAVLLALLNVFQTLALAYMAGRSRKVRQGDPPDLLTRRRRKR